MPFGLEESQRLRFENQFQRIFLSVQNILKMSRKAVFILFGSSNLLLTLFYFYLVWPYSFLMFCLKTLFSKLNNCTGNFFFLGKICKPRFRFSKSNSSGQFHLENISGQFHLVWLTGLHFMDLVKKWKNLLKKIKMMLKNIY